MHWKSPCLDDALFHCFLSHLLLTCIVPFSLETFQGFLYFSYNLLLISVFLGLHRKSPYLKNALFHCHMKIQCPLISCIASLPCTNAFRNTSRFPFFLAIQHCLKKHFKEGFFCFSFNFIHYQWYLGLHGKNLYFSDKLFHCIIDIECPFIWCIASLPCNIALRNI